MNESELIRNCQKGDNASFGKLYDLYVREIYNFIYFKTLHKQTAEDLTSEAFFKALKSIGQCDPDRPFKSWVYRIAQNTVIDHYRKARPTADIDDIWDIQDENGTNIAEDIDNREKIKELKKLMRKLPQIQRDIVILRVWQEMPYKEIAAIVGKSEANCKMIYSRTLASLRGEMSVAAIILLLMNLK